MCVARWARWAQDSYPRRDVVLLVCSKRALAPPLELLAVIREKCARCMRVGHDPRAQQGVKFLSGLIPSAFFCSPHVARGSDVQDKLFNVENVEMLKAFGC